MSGPRSRPLPRPWRRRRAELSSPGNLLLAVCSNRLIGTGESSKVNARSTENTMTHPTSMSHQLSPVCTVAASACMPEAGVSAYFYGYWCSQGVALSRQAAHSAPAAHRKNQETPGRPPDRGFCFFRPRANESRGKRHAQLLPGLPLLQLAIQWSRPEPTNIATTDTIERHAE